MSDTPQTDEAQFGTGRVSVDFARRLERELVEAREQRDRLAEALKGMLNVTYGQVIYNFMEPQRSAAREALAAAKGGKDE